MDDASLKKIIEVLESKERDCIAFSKKYKSRNMEDMVQYYDGADWAIKFAITLIKETCNK